MVGWLIIKFLGVIDLIAAYVILTSSYDLPFIMEAVILGTLLISGIMNFFYRDAVSVIDGATDLASVFLIVTAFAAPGALKLIIILIMVEKGLVSIF